MPSGFAYYIYCFNEIVFPGRLELHSMQTEGEAVAQVFVERDIKRFGKIPVLLLHRDVCGGREPQEREDVLVL